MKFLCDRCKTRYSIGDDRVRGKILKIRCKNCANVITVREGMMADPDAPPVPLEPARVKKPTTGAPEALNELEARSREPARARDASPQRSERRSEDNDRALAHAAHMSGPSGARGGTPEARPARNRGARDARMHMSGPSGARGARTQMWPRRPGG